MTSVGFSKGCEPIVRFMNLVNLSGRAQNTQGAQTFT